MASLPQDPEFHFERHVLCCNNQRAPGHPRSCCADRGAKPLMDYLAKRIDELGIEDIKITEVGCMERCELGPTVVVYPEAVWYTYENEDDVDEIIDRHFRKGEVVERLNLEVEQKLPKPKVKETLALTVVEVKDETPSIKSFVLARANGAELPAWTAGAHVDVITGSGLRRSYSLANDPADRSCYVIGVLREKEGRGGSAWMHDHLTAGDTLKVVPPLNNFPLDETAAQHILIAGGIGITPILAMGRALKAHGARFHLNYCTKSREDTAFLDEVKKVFGDNVTFYHDDGDPSKGIDLAAYLKDRPEGAHLYICGPAGLILAAEAAASHWPEGTVHYELFAAPNQSQAWHNEPFTVYLSRRKQEITVPADKSLLEAVREAGVYLDSSCEEGLCSTCIARVISGGIEHRDQVLTEKERAKGDRILTCVSRATPGEKLVLDL